MLLSPYTLNGVGGMRVAVTSAAPDFIGVLGVLNVRCKFFRILSPQGLRAFRWPLYTFPVEIDETPLYAAWGPLGPLPEFVESAPFSYTYAKYRIADVGRSQKTLSEFPKTIKNRLHVIVF